MIQQVLGIDNMMGKFSKSKVLVTGGTGSFGQTVVKYLLKNDVAEIRIFSRDEKKQHDLRKKFNDDSLKFHIGDVRDQESVDTSMEDVDYVYHAAALKQVPSCEFYPMEAYKTNVVGTNNVLNAAIKNRVKKVVCLSTDKAVYPINAMGISKAMMEKLVAAKSRISKSTSFVSTRYGNVMASRGSVIPLFVEQIKQCKPLTITDPNMTRFMMSLDDSVDLVLHAFEHGDSGDLFVQKAPAATVGAVANALKKIFNADNPIEIIGTRHGEKLYESLLAKEEFAKAKDLGRYFRVKPDNRDLNYGKYFSEGDEKLEGFEEYHSHNTNRLNQDELCNLLLSLDYIKNELKG